MPDAVKAEFAFTLEVRETVALSADHVVDPTVRHSLGADNGTLNATSTPAATKTSSDTIALAAGAGTLDLTAATGLKGGTVDFTGLKVQIVKLKTPPGNSASIVVERKDAATGYNLFGDDNNSDESVEVPPDTLMQFKYNDTLEDVGASNKDLRFTGTGTDQIEIQLVAG